MPSSIQLRHATGRRRERGQTIALMAVSMLSILAFAAVAIDLTTLYAARGEVQRAADSAALAAGKAFADSGVVSYPANVTLQNLARTMATDAATAVLQQNTVAGSAAQFVSPPNINFSVAGNPRVTVNVQRTGLPLFFARIWGNRSASVSATATAEAYNPAFAQKNTGTFLPSAPKCVKPFLVPNTDPVQNVPFVKPGTGQVNPAASSFIGEELRLISGCQGAVVPGCIPKPRNPNPHPQPGEYLPMLVSGNHQYCPSSSALGCAGNSGTDFERSIECCDGAAFDFQRCGTSGTAAFYDPTVNPLGAGQPTRSGLQCLIHTTNPGPPSGTPQQDTIDLTALLSNAGQQITPGTFSQARYAVQPSSLMSTSDSIITVPIFDNRVLPLPSTQVTIVGFLQLFVNYNGPSGSAGLGPAGFDTYILNVIGCGNAGGTPAISGGGASPIPVRLVHN
jgi:hypothetical protein